MSDRPRFPPNIAILVSIIAVSTASILIRMSNAPPLIIAMYRMIFSTVILSPFFIQNKGIQKVSQLGSRGVLSLMGVGVVLAIHFASWITSVTMTSVASSVIFVHIDPIFVALISHFFLDEKVGRRTVVGIVIGILGATVIAFGDMGLGGLNFMGDALALVGGVMLGIYILAGRQLRQNMDLTTYVTPVYASAAVVLFLMSIFTSTALVGYSMDEYLLFSVIALVPMIFGHTVYNWALKYVSAPIVSLSLLGEPVGASVLAYVFLSEVPSVFVLVGGVLTLVGILISSYRVSQGV